MKTNNNLITLDQFKDKHYGKIGTAKRDKLETGYTEFKMGAMIQEARLEKGMTQEELADKCGTNKAYISRVENNIKDVRLSTLQKIVEVGLGGHLNLSISL
jgi:ribosome-binding protein aMBF1 (putative translation factor)